MEKALKITAIVLFILIMGFFVLQTWLGHKVASVIEEKGSQLNGGAYQVEVGDSRVNLFARSVTLKDVRLTPDSTKAGEPDPDEIQLDLSIDGVYAAGFNLKMIRGKVPFKLRIVQIDHPVISADLYDSARKETDDTTAVNNRGKKTFDIPTRRLVVNDGSVVLRQHKGGQSSYTEATGIEVDVRENSSGLDSTAGLAALLKGELSVSGMVLTNADSSVDTVIDTVQVDLNRNSINIAAVRVEPRYAKTEFVYKNSRHRDWTRLGARNISVEGIDATVPGILTAGDGSLNIVVDNIYVGSGSVESYKDRNAYQPYWVRKLLFESVWEIPFGLTVNKAVVDTFDAVYSEFPKMGVSAGIINFTGLSATVTGLSNIPSSSEPYYTLAAHGFIYGAAPLNATFYFPKAPATNRFEVTVSLGRMDLTNLNKTVVPLAKAEVESGMVDKMEFHIVGDRHTASVDMELLYHDLKVDLVKYKANHEVKERRFLSWIANEFVIKDSNPSNGETRHGSGSAERELDRSQFNFLWKTLLQGIKESAGL